MLPLLIFIYNYAIAILNYTVETIFSVIILRQQKRALNRAPEFGIL